MISNNVNLAIAATIATTSGISYQVFSETGNPSDNRINTADKHWWNKNVPRAYALSDTQIEKISKIRLQQSERIASIQNKLKKLRMEIEELGRVTKVNMKKLRSYKVKIWNLEDKILDINQETESQIRKVLFGHQLKYFDSSGYGWWSLVDHGWASDDDKMINNSKKMRMSDRGFSW